MARIITRTWVTKSGEVKTKSYNYTNKHKGRDLTLIYKSGKINPDAPINALRNQYAQGDLIKETEFNATYRDFLATAKKGAVRKRLTWRGLQSRLSSNAIERVIRNFGYDPEEFAIELSTATNQEVNVDYLYNESNWSNDFEYLKLPDGKLVHFEYNYEGGVLFTL